MKFRRIVVLSLVSLTIGIATILAVSSSSSSKADRKYGSFTPPTAIPTTLPPSGAAGGDLYGSTYPNPKVAAISGDAGNVSVSANCSVFGSDASALVYDCTNFVYVDAAVATTGYSFALSQSTLMNVTAKIACRNESNNGDAFYGEIQSTYQRYDGSAPVLVGDAGAIVNDASAGGGSNVTGATSISGNSVLVTVTGINASLYGCNVEVEVEQVQ